MSRRLLIAVALAAAALVFGAWWRYSGAPRSSDSSAVSRSEPEPFVGSGSCRQCHEQFYELWSTSHHGLASQPFTQEFARASLTQQADDVVIGRYRYRFDLDERGGRMLERGPDGETSYPIEHVLGGKNLYYFLTPLERGHLQVLPIAYDVRKRNWYDTTASMVRHAGGLRDEALHWRERPLTFNTSCYSCHVSQLAKNYDPDTDSYRTVWAEPGINCETCHGPAGDHVRVCRDAPPGKAPEDLRIIVTRTLTVQQRNDLCAPCHAKMTPLTTDFLPGDRYFDHYDVATLEDPDFYPDGRDLGENYTYTLWLSSPCAKSGQLDCMHCHTPSGRYRFGGETANGACSPCHEEKVANPAAHTRHAAGSRASECISCHMPETTFARMRRTDHSMQPPTPAATLSYKSPNACNLCHTDRSAAWADAAVRRWHHRDYQAPVLHRAGLIAAARAQDWSRLPEMLEYIAGPERDEIVATSLIRLLAASGDERKWPALRGALEDPSPLVRSAAAFALSPLPDEETRAALAEAAGDDFRVVRIRAAMTLSTAPPAPMGDAKAGRLAAAARELETALLSRPDDWASHYNLGNYLFNRGETRRALASFQAASRLQPGIVAPHVNASMAHAALGRTAEAEASLRRALEIEPAGAEANFNLGLLLGEKGELRQAEQHLRQALKTDPGMHQAAYNLGVLLGSDRVREAIQWCRKALELSPEEPRYAYTLAFYLNRSGDLAGAAAVLGRLIEGKAADADAYLLLGSIYEKQDRRREAAGLYRRAMSVRDLSPQDVHRIEARLRELQR